MALKGRISSTATKSKMTSSIPVRAQVIDVGLLIRQVQVMVQCYNTTEQQTNLKQQIQ